MRVSGYIKLIHHDRVMDKQVYSSREERERVIEFWKHSYKTFEESFIQFSPDLDDDEVRLIMVPPLPEEEKLAKLQEESKLRHDAKNRIDWGKIKELPQKRNERTKRERPDPPKIPMVRPKAEYSNTKSLYGLTYE